MLKFYKVYFSDRVITVAAPDKERAQKLAKKQLPFFHFKRIVKVREDTESIPLTEAGYAQKLVYMDVVDGN